MLKFHDLYSEAERTITNVQHMNEYVLNITLIVLGACVCGAYPNTELVKNDLLKNVRWDLFRAVGFVAVAAWLIGVVETKTNVSLMEQ